VRVVYEAIEVDVFSPNDEIRREGTGVLFADRSGRTVVLTARSLCDASYFETDGISGDPDIEDEEIRVLLAEGPVFRAGRIWVDPKGSDLALLVLEPEEASLNVEVTAADRLAFDEMTDAAKLWLQATDDTIAALDPVPLGLDPVLLKDATDLPDLDTYRGAVILRDGVVVGVLGQKDGATPEPAIAPVAPLPPALRPRQ
jgi:hypothetical protein